jgi:hypothetical protein
MYGGSRQNNEAFGVRSGGGVHGGFTLGNEAAVIEGNKAREADSAGGVYVGQYGRLYSYGLIQNNEARGPDSGGGVYVDDANAPQVLLYTGGTIKGNTANEADSGGGVYVKGGTFSLEGTITGNTANKADSSGGVYVKGGTFNLAGGTITGNAANEVNSGGGVYVKGGTFNLAGGTFNLAEGTIGGSNPAADANTAVSGANGVYIAGGKFEMKSGGTIRGNTAVGYDNYGVYVKNTAVGSFIMSSSARVDQENKVFLASGATITLSSISGSEPAAYIVCEVPPSPIALSATADNKGEARKLLSVTSYDQAYIDTYKNLFYYNGMSGKISDAFPEGAYYYGYYQEPSP